MSAAFYILPLALSVALSLVLTPWVKRAAFKIGAVDEPGEARRIHRRVTARLGGLAIFGAILVSTLVTLPLSRQLSALLLAAAVLTVIGAIDDIRGLAPLPKLLGQFGAAGIALAGGIGITVITNPFGGVIDLSWGRFLVEVGPISFHVTPIANALSLLWMVGMVNVVNFLDGVDGLAAGVSAIAATALFVLSIKTGQPVTAILALIVVGAALGFLPYNFNPARIFLGDSGAYVLGLMLAMIAIYAGSKLAAAVLVLGLPIIDGIWTVIRRLARRRSPFRADKGHLHHLLLDAGLSQRQAVLLLYASTAALGTVAVAAGSWLKLVVFGALLAAVAALLGVLAQSVRRS